MSEEHSTLPFTLPALLNGAERIEKYKALYLFKLNQYITGPSPYTLN